VEALSYKLNNYENAIKEELKLNNRDYRVNYEPEKMMSLNGSQIGDKETGPLANDPNSAQY